MDNTEIIAILENIAELLEVKGENVFKSRSYLNVARAIKFMSEEVSDLVVQGRVREIPGVGDAIEQKLTEMVTTGKLEFYEKLKAEFPPGINGLLKIKGIGPKTAAHLIKELQINSREELAEAISSGRISSLPHVSKEKFDSILAQIKNG
jgi:DNA polymerase (family 10)